MSLCTTAKTLNGLSRGKITHGCNRLGPGTRRFPNQAADTPVRIVSRQKDKQTQKIGRIPACTPRIERGPEL